MYFDNTWLTYCLLLGILMFFASTFIVAVFLKALHEERTQLRSRRKNLEDTIKAWDEANEDLAQRHAEFDSMFGNRLKNLLN